MKENGPGKDSIWRSRAGIVGEEEEVVCPEGGACSFDKMESAANGRN
jgi:hypothetical protein